MVSKPAQQLQQPKTFNKAAKVEAPSDAPPKQDPPKSEPPKDDFKNSLAALIGRGRPGGPMKKVKVEEPKVVPKKVDIFEAKEEKSVGFIALQKPDIKRRKRGTVVQKKDAFDFDE